MYKVPGRDITTETLGGWLKEMIWVYVIMKVFKTDIDAITGTGPNPEAIQTEGDG